MAKENTSVIATGGKQYVVKEGQTLMVEKLAAEPGATLQFEDKLNGKKVHATLVEHGRGKKIQIIKFRNKTRYLRRAGHRQAFSRITIGEIG